MSGETTIKVCSPRAPKKGGVRGGKNAKRLSRPGKAVKLLTAAGNTAGQHGLIASAARMPGWHDRACAADGAVDLPFSSEVFQNGFDDFLCCFGGEGVDAGLDFVAAAGETLFERNII